LNEAFILSPQREVLRGLIHDADALYLDTVTNPDAPICVNPAER